MAAAPQCLLAQATRELAGRHGDRTAELEPHRSSWSVRGAPGQPEFRRERSIGVLRVVNLAPPLASSLSVTAAVSAWGCRQSEPGSRDAHEVVATSQEITVSALPTTSDARCSWRVTGNTPAAERQAMLEGERELLLILAGMLSHLMC